jgi:hypothetical protein
MSGSARTHNKFWSLLAIVAVSSATMLWLFWHYPRVTGIATLIVLAAFAVLVRLARAVDAEGMPEFDPGTHGV